MSKVDYEVKDVSFWSSSRFSLAVMSFFGFVIVYALRASLSVTIVCMVNHTAIDNGSDVTDSECFKVKTTNNSDSTNLNQEGGSLEWDKPTQGIILGSIFWGYTISQVPAAWLGLRVGAKKMMGISSILASAATVLIPLLAQTHYGALMVVRILMGVVAGVTNPSMHTLWGQWAPPWERSKLVAFTYSGGQIGKVAIFLLSGFLCKYGFAGGWPSIFYIVGVATLLWSVLWLLLVSDSPSKHPRISRAERDFIVDSLKEGVSETKKDLQVPWLSIATSAPVYAIIVANISSDWGYFMLVTSIPTFINNVLKFDITSNGLFSALPYLGYCLVIVAGGWLADFIIGRSLLSTTTTRKIFNTLGELIPASMLVALGYLDCSQQATAIFLLVCAVSSSGLIFSGYVVSPVDIAPELAGIVLGVSNSLGAITGIVSPLIVGIITDHNPTRRGWQIVFFVAAAIYGFGAIVFAIFASGELQPWANPDTGTGESEMEDMESKEH